ncbi:hypothetical protein HK102_012752, partial [Quaeritorhiza haematococci]
TTEPDFGVTSHTPNTFKHTHTQPALANGRAKPPSHHQHQNQQHRKLTRPKSTSDLFRDIDKDLVMAVESMSGLTGDDTWGLNTNASRDASRDASRERRLRSSQSVARLDLDST